MKRFSIKLILVLGLLVCGALPVAAQPAVQHPIHAMTSSVSPSQAEQNWLSENNLIPVISAR